MTSTTGTTQHPDVSEISDLTEGLLSPARSADVRRHLDDCGLCSDVRTSLEEIRGLLGTLPGPSRMPAEIAGRIDAALAAEALLNATAPEEPVDVSRETAVAALAPAPSEDRPSGHARGATGPGRSRPARRRRRVAVLGAAFGVAAVGATVLFLQGVTPSSDPGASKKAYSTSAEAPRFGEATVAGRVHELLSSGQAAGRPSTKREGPSSLGVSPEKPLGSLAVPVPECVRQGTGRSEQILASDKGVFDGAQAYLLVLPHATDSSQVEAYVMEASCATGSEPTRAASVLLTHAYPRT
ncbi:hypothetical protein ABT160_08655 [Streptomyces sp. NPDC001941]|uniref:hypothetical protein n=1 Tax=Streptomyces sp. NPDC001941 TaxID=3154659 RepID=UPI0033283CBC